MQQSYPNSMEYSQFHLQYLYTKNAIQYYVLQNDVYIINMLK